MFNWPLLAEAVIFHLLLGVCDLLLKGRSTPNISERFLPCSEPCCRCVLRSLNSRRLHTPAPNGPSSRLDLTEKPVTIIHQQIYDVFLRFVYILERLKRMRIFSLNFVAAQCKQMEISNGIIYEPIGSSNIIPYTARNRDRCIYRNQSTKWVWNPTKSVHVSVTVSLTVQCKHFCTL